MTKQLVTHHSYLLLPVFALLLFLTAGAAYTQPNTFYGFNAGANNTTGGPNAFVGASAGQQNTTGEYNAFVGASAGQQNTTGIANTFIGALAGLSNTTENNNTFIGFQAKGVAGITNATAIGAGATVTQNDTMVLGTSAVTVSAPGRLDVASTILVHQLGTAGSAQLYRNSAGQISNCSASLRYKQEVQPFTAGLEMVNQLQPIKFIWKDSNQPDIALAAEQVSAVEPLLVTHNEHGEVEGVKYDQLNVVLINAIKQQQAQIGSQQSQIDNLKTIICLDHPSADVCK